MSLLENSRARDHHVNQEKPDQGRRNPDQGGTGWGMKTEGSFFVRGREPVEVGRRREEKGGMNTSKVQQYE